MRFLITCSLLGLLCAGSARAETYTIDPVHSTIRFDIRHFFTKVGGRFTEFNGTVDFNKDAPETSKVRATIASKSIFTANKKRDEHLRSADFFHAEKHPDITFQSTKVKVIDKSNGEITGDLTMNGVTRPVTLQVKYLGEAVGMQGERRSGFEATTTLNRKDFGIVWNNVVEGTAVLGDEVEIEIQIAAIKQ